MANAAFHVHAGLDVIVAEVERRRLQRIAIFGARVTVETKLFGRLQNVDVVTPSSREVDLLNSIYVRIVELNVSPLLFPLRRFYPQNAPKMHNPL